MSKVSRQSGFTIIELMIALGIIAILSAIAVPMYNDYIETGEDGRLASNIATIEVFQERVLMREGAYANDLADIAAIEAATGWNPRANDGVTYSIAASDGTLYQVTATAPDGRSFCLEFPSKDPC
jgi:prepilin-type N-terminal cleavage/methylation domain-containing protein